MRLVGVITRPPVRPWNRTAKATKTNSMPNWRRLPPNSCLRAFIVNFLASRRGGRVGGNQGHEAHQALLSGFFGVDAAGDDAGADGVDAVAGPEEFREFRRDHHDGLARVGEGVHDAVHLVLRADVDAARRFVEDQQFRLGEQPLRDDDLLLVSAGQLYDALVDARRLDTQLPAVLLSSDVLGIAVDDTTGRDARQVRRYDRRSDGVEEVQSEHLAVLGDVGEAEIDGLLDVLRRHLAAVQEHRALDVTPVGAAEQRSCELRTPCAHEAGETDDLAAADLEGGALADEAFGHLRVPDRPVLDLQEDFLRMRRVVREARRQLAADHAADESVLVHALAGGNVDGLDAVAVSDDRDRVSDGGDLVQLVADHDACHAVTLELADEVQQVRGVRLVQGRGRLVKDQELDVLADRFGDLHELLLADPETLDVAVGVVVEPDPGHQRLGALPGRQPVDAAASSHLVAKEDVLGDGQLGDERQLLVDDDDAGALAVAGVRELGWVALEEDLSLVRAVGMDA